LTITEFHENRVSVSIDSAPIKPVAVAGATR
jgi:hypothetical protein